MTNFNNFIYDNAINDYLFAIFFVYIGWFLASNNDEFNPVSSILLVSVGVVVSLLEILLLWKRFDVLPTVSGHLIGTIPFTVGAAMCALSMPDIGRNSRITKFGRYTLGVYASHYLFVSHLPQLGSYIDYPFPEIIYPAAVYSLSLLLVMLLAKNKWLKRVVI
ncbi:MAG: hypothetical protein HZB33_05555 [Nitrospirae bacterium]|nr:hypothetical protein [Nitrospirota bacterium]